ncbi:helix-turn-helix domain-containing protein [Bacillus altitudinis]|uniref:helix-turn-helix domain-containing protein n=1 Tax=Bacillus altitudinis TaxID=293387 RepID=UPI003CEAA2F9
METKQSLPEILTAKDIASYLGISRRRVYEILQLSEDHGGMRFIQIGSSKRVEKRDFFDWIEKNKSNCSERG